MKKYLLSAVLTVAGFLMIAVGLAAAHAATTQPNGPLMPGLGGMGFAGGKFSGVAGNVTAVNGTSLTVQSMRSSSTVYTVDASNATVRKNNATSTVGAIAVGDTVMVRGTVNGMSVTATSIFDGKFMPGNFMAGRRGMMNASGTPRGIQGRPMGMATGTRPTAPVTHPLPMNPRGTGPGVVGTVTAIDGTTLTVQSTHPTSTVYMVDASNATVRTGNTTGTISMIAVGDTVMVQGSASGTAVTATNILDTGTASSTPNLPPEKPQPQTGFFGSIGNFFKNIFKF